LDHETVLGDQAEPAERSGEAGAAVRDDVVAGLALDLGGRTRPASSFRAATERRKTVF
jgi:hypothetical protein